MNPYRDSKTGEFTNAPSSVLGRGHATLTEAHVSIVRQEDAIQRAASMSGKMPALRHAPVAVQVGNRYHVVTSGEAKKYALPIVRQANRPVLGETESTLATLAKFNSPGSKAIAARVKADQSYMHRRLGIPKLTK